jgi:serine/threonine protein kinase
MPVTCSADQLLDLLRKTALVEPKRLESYLDQQRAAQNLPAAGKELAKLLVRDGLLTYFQAEQLLQGRWRGFTLGKYRILERLGSGGMGVVYLAEHSIMRRRVAIKVLPVALAEDPWFIEQFLREAQLIAALDHPNIVRAHDIDKEGNLHYLVLEYVDGACLHDVIAKHGPMDVLRATHYIRQAALGLQHAYEIGLVHRDIKPGNLLLDRKGTVKILDMGLACFTRKHPSQNGASANGERRMVGTDDYLAPEQIVNSDDVDIRADIYSLAATFYYLLTGRPPFHEAAKEHHKLIWHLTRRPKPVCALRPEVPAGLSALIELLLAKNPWERLPNPAALVEALAPWAATPIGPPPSEEMPSLSPCLRNKSLEMDSSSVTRGANGRSWVICNAASANNSGILPAPSTAPGQGSATSTGGNASRQPPKPAGDQGR